MSIPRPTRSRRAASWPKLGLLVGLALAVTTGCGQQDEAAQYRGLIEAEEPLPEAEPPLPATAPAPGKAGAHLDDEDVAELRSLDYVSGEGSTAPQPSALEEKAQRASARKAPDSGALSELDYRNAQILNQRANEALDYLGPQAMNAPSSSEELEVVVGGAFAEERRRAVRDANELGDTSGGWEEVRRLKAKAEAHVGDKKRSRVGARGRGRYDVKDLATTLEPGKRKSAPLSPAQRFQQERRSLENLTFQSSAGYWANTYVPGDPVLRWLESRLAERDRSTLQRFARQPLLLEAASHQTSQPFDAPSSAAISVFVQADRRGLEGEERMLVQVGLQGAHRRGGLRPAMSVGVVLDARGAIADSDVASMRALLEAFLQAKDMGDRFSLTVAGRPGGELIAPDAFRHGPLTLAMGQLFETDDPGRGKTLGLVEALQRTASALQRGDDPEAPLGSSMVLLVTSQPLAHCADDLVDVAHRSAVAGVPVSVVAVGEGAKVDEVERVALAGQGNRRLLNSAAEAEGVVDRELSALSRVIARALRLNIRLAPGVKLVEVVGADRLDAAGAQRVRSAEQSIDRRLAHNLGIETDRGADEDGIQVVIPTFHSSDSHAVLLDVVASGPGPIADVTVRYKDLVYLRNSVARTNLTLARGNEPPGALERNVVKNYLAARLASTLKQAGRSLLEGGDVETIVAVRDFQALLDGLQREVPSFRNDPELAMDSAMLGEYLALLESNVLDTDEPRRYLADSLQLSGYFKTVPRSTPLGRASRR